MRISKAFNIRQKEQFHWFYLLETLNQDFTAVGTDLLIQIKPVPFVGSGLENKACDGGVLGFRKRPLQKNTC